MLKNVNLILDVFTSLGESDGNLSLDVIGYIGDNDDPTFEFGSTFESIIDEHIEMCSIPSDPRTMRPEHKEEAKEPLLRMIDILTRKIEHIDSIPLWGGKNESAL